MGNTEINRKSLIDKLSAARLTLMLQMPFYGTLIMNMKTGLSDCGTACTDMRKILWDPAFLNRIDVDETCFVMLHEVMHCVLDHIGRGKGKVHQIYNIASDIVVNSNLLVVFNTMQFSATGRKVGFCVDGREVMHLAPDGVEGREYTADQVYEMLLRKYENQMDDAEGLFASLREDYGDITDNHDIWEAVQVTAEMRDGWKHKVLESLRVNSCGSIHDPGIRRLLDSEDYKPVINWREVLKNFIQIVADTYDFTFAPPDRRFAEGDYILPAYNEQDGEKIENIWMVIDTSCSIDDWTLTSVLEEVKFSIGQFTSIRGQLSCFDTEISEPVDFECVEDLDRMEITGGGGTSFHCIFDYLKEHMTDAPPVAIIILTDGYAAWPDEEAAMDIPVLWMLINNIEDVPWGKSIHVELDW